MKHPLPRSHLVHVRLNPHSPSVRTSFTDEPILSVYQYQWPHKYNVTKDPKTGSMDGQMQRQLWSPISTHIRRTSGCYFCLHTHTYTHSQFLSTVSYSRLDWVPRKRTLGAGVLLAGCPSCTQPKVLQHWKKINTVMPSDPLAKGRCALKHSGLTASTQTTKYHYYNVCNKLMTEC